VLPLCVAHGQDLKSAQACTRLEDDAARLACYDSALGAPKVGAPNVAAPNLAAPKPPAPQQSGTVKSDPTAQFGDNGQFKPKPPNLPRNLTAKVLQAAALPRGQYQVTLDNGQIWQTTDANWTTEFKAGDPVIITRMTFGGYQISLAAHGPSCGASRIK
jgi:hypothetical protein